MMSDFCFLLLLKTKKETKNEDFKPGEIEMNELIEWIKEATKVKWGQYAIAYTVCTLCTFLFNWTAKSKWHHLFHLFTHLLFWTGSVCVHFIRREIKEEKTRIFSVRFQLININKCNTFHSLGIQNDHFVRIVYVTMDTVWMHALNVFYSRKKWSNWIISTSSPTFNNKMRFRFVLTWFTKTSAKQCDTQRSKMINQQNTNTGLFQWLDPYLCPKLVLFRYCSSKSKGIKK